MSPKTPSGIKIVATNRQAGFRYELLDKYEAGMILLGSEVKSLRDGNANIGDSYVVHTRAGELVLFNSHISHYPPANRMNHEPLRARKLLLHAHELEHLIGKLKERGLTLIPTQIYFKNGRAKIEICLARGKKSIDKRQDIKKKEQKREMDKAIKSQRRLK
jgi:SsrA-binding protein